MSAHQQPLFALLASKATEIKGFTHYTITKFYDLKLLITYMNVIRDYDSQTSRRTDNDLRTAIARLMSNFITAIC